MRRISRPQCWRCSINNAQRRTLRIRNTQSPQLRNDIPRGQCRPSGTFSSLSLAPIGFDDLARLHQPIRQALSDHETKAGTLTVKSGAFQQSMYEADVGGSVQDSSRIVDKPKPLDNLDVWVKILDFRVRLDGLRGAWIVFEGLRARKIDLPTGGEYVAQLWEPIVRAALVLERMPQLWLYVQDLHERTGRRFKGLYVLIVGHYLPINRDYAMHYHKELRTLDLPQIGHLRSLVMAVDMTPKTAATLAQIYTDSHRRGLYDIIITRLCSSRQYNDAVLWHWILMTNQDVPSSERVVEPLITYLSFTGQTKVLKDVLQSLARQTGFKALRRRASPVLRLVSNSSQYEGTISRSQDGSSRKIVSDEFCARAFATRAFTPSFVIKSLAAFGVRSIGPVSLRELALRCRSLIKSFDAGEGDPPAVLAREVAVQLDQLQANDISLQSGKFTTIISTLAHTGQGKLLDAVLSSDQHPDVYDDTDLQVRLLSSYLQSRDWAQVHRTLAVLLIGHGRLAWSHWNHLLYSQMSSIGPNSLEQADQILATMRHLRVPLDGKLLTQAWSALLRPRKAGKRPQTLPDAISRLNYTTRMLLDAQSSGLVVPAAMWSEILRRYGMAGMYHELERVSLWLAHHYTLRLGVASTSGRRRLPGHELNHIFPRLMQRAIVEWYFKCLQFPHFFNEFDVRRRETAGSATSPVLATSPLHLRGLALLRILRRYGLEIDAGAVRAAVRTRLVALYGGGLSKRRHNRVAEMENPFTLTEVVRQVQDMWAPLGNLLNLPVRLLRREMPAEERVRVERLLSQSLLGRAVMAKPRNGQRDPRRALNRRRRAANPNRPAFDEEAQPGARVVTNGWVRSRGARKGTRLSSGHM